MATVGLYALKPWWSRRLRGLVGSLDARDVHPDVVSWSGVGFAVLAGVVLATGPGPVTSLVVALLLVARLGCANLDGQLARRHLRSTLEERRGALVGELTDRLADLAPLAGWALLGLPLWLVLTAALASSAPAFVSLAGLAAGHPTRLQAGPGGKTERCLVLACSALGFVTAWSVVLITVSLGSAALRVRQVWR